MGTNRRLIEEFATQLRHHEMDSMGWLWTASKLNLSTKLRTYPTSRTTGIPAIEKLGKIRRTPLVVL
jgi:hypothetical protein